MFQLRRHPSRPLALPQPVATSLSLCCRTRALAWLGGASPCPHSPLCCYPLSGGPVVGTFCGHCDGTEGGVLGAGTSRAVSAGRLSPKGFVSWTLAPNFTAPSTALSLTRPPPPTLSTLLPEPCVPLCHPLGWHPCKADPQGLPGWQFMLTPWRQPGASLWQDSARLRQQEPGFKNHPHTWLYFSSL